MFSRLAGIVKEHGADDQTLSRNCCAMLAGISYMPDSHVGLSADNVMETLFLTTGSEDVITRELTAITMCNMTTTMSAAERLIKSGVCGIVATLSGATSERMQELCAKCICNLTCARHLHQEMISHGILQTILLIALVRTVKDRTKLICARAVMNLMSDDTIEALKTAGAIRVFCLDCCCARYQHKRPVRPRLPCFHDNTATTGGHLCAQYRPESFISDGQEPICAVPTSGRTNRLQSPFVPTQSKSQYSCWRLTCNQDHLYDGLSCVARSCC